ncbi:MAG: D-aminoacylase [Sediminibacterium sp.]|nr:D-aminoacylase [Sediminibacterium sp.]
MLLNRTLLSAFLVFTVVFSKAQTADLILQNGRILDGTGNAWYKSNIAISNGKIVAIGKLSGWSATRTIDVQNQIVAPGFIDVHTHIEGDEKKNPLAENFIMDGVTTVVTGNCGLGQTNIEKYFSMIDSLHTSINVASLIGHNDVRKAAMGTANRLPTEAEMQRMEQIVEAAMKSGAVGFSTGLIYIPGTYSKTEEVIRLAAVAAKYNGVYASHIRSEGDSVVPAIREAINIGKAAGIPVEISHFKVSGQQNWGRSSETISLVAAARAEGQDVTIDQYPYTASSTSLSTLLPDWVLADGNDSIKARLNRPDVKARVIQHMITNLKKRSLKHFSYTVVAFYKADTTYNGKSIEEINLLKGNPHKLQAEAETIISMMLQGGASMVFHGMSEKDVSNIMKVPYNMIASDAGIRVLGAGVPHPRGYGTNARVLGKYVREKNIITLEEAIRRMTSLPARKFNIENRGMIREGAVADIVVFDENTVNDLATFDQPHQLSTGFSYVLVNGQITVDQGKHIGTRAGKVIRWTGGK